MPKDKLTTPAPKMKTMKLMIKTQFNQFWRYATTARKMRRRKEAANVPTRLKIPKMTPW